MVALDAKTGRKIWERPYVFKEDSWVFFLSYADEVLISLITSSKYHLSAFDAKSGEQIWDQEYGWDEIITVELCIIRSLSVIKYMLNQRCLI